MNGRSGGFLQSGPLLSPPPSSLASSARVSLPHSRALPLKSGSAKESELLRYLDERILHIQRRFAKRGVRQSSAPHTKEDVEGYKSFAEAAKDIEELVDILWMSGTPGIQVPYLLSLALLVADLLPAFPASSKATLRLLNKLDLVFASLLQGRNLETGEILSGFDSGRAVSITEKVRIKSLVEQTRIRVVRVLGAEFGTEASAVGDVTENEMDTETDDDYGTGVGTTREFGDDYDNDEEDDEDVFEESMETDRREINIAKVYDRTVVELGDVLGGTPIGIITND